MDPLVLLLIVVTTILTTLLVVVGIQVILILKEIRQSLGRINNTLDTVDQMVVKIKQPLASLGGVVEGVKSGMKIAETFIDWLKKKQGEEDDQDDE